jgi:hypothetical protein
VTQRSRGTALLALLALLASGAATALLIPSPVAAQSEEAAPALATSDAAPERTESTASGALPRSDSALRQQPVLHEDDPPTEPVDPPQWNPTATYDSPPPAEAPDPEPAAGAPPADSGAPAANGDASPEPAPDPGPAQPSQPSGTVAAQNTSRVLQAIWQVQVGCRTYCRGTRQSQSASQQSETRQDATAVAPQGEPSGAAAVNESLTIQFVWQMQLGCVAFCWDTSMDQSASQEAQTLQMATAASVAAALGLNVAETLQYVWQFQDGCKIECYGADESQSLSQRQTTSQSATATGPADRSYTDGPPDGAEGFFSWLTAIAQNLGVTLQMVYQYQLADCLEHCDVETLEQIAAQLAVTDQTATAGDVPEPVSEPSTPGEPPPAASEPPPASQQPPASGTALALAAAAALGREPPAGSSRDRRVPGQADGNSDDRRSTGDSPGRASAQQSPRALAPPRWPSALAAPRAPRGDAAHAQGPRTARGRPARADQPSAAGRGTTGDPATSASRSLHSAPVAFDEAAAAESGDDPGIPWLTVAFLVIAGLAVIQSLRLRPVFRG